ncbi:aminotransferase class V-fold PLP-dependent enzyme [Bacillus sp. Marseille-Q1617]|uniref:aminotransferase class V-fold PLP-dependent enzyme n=1 Tax=Bacillus sp. Marseille-Q1617 TaxID=2736887 RepID=UPI00158A3E82|nr:aminotransferase class V-fold PLP-dependent enzyme [Bacillus sp. Marseille-Q1617]
MREHSFVYKIATDPYEFQQINQLNYQTFVKEIPQHEANDKEQLVDKFHDENTYIIAKYQEQIIGMIAVRANRPFSLDLKIKDLDEYIPADSVPCEVRLLSVKEEYRSTRVFYGLCERLVQFCLEKRYNLALISGTVRQLKLYRRIGFKPFASLVGEEEARFQPMYLTKESFEQSTKAFQKLMRSNSRDGREGRSTLRHSFLPGPVPLHPEVEKAFREASVSHRSTSFIQEVKGIQSVLCDSTKANHAQIVLGTGTLTNDMVAQQLKLLNGEGLILANGEFGYRLIEHAYRSGLSFRTIEKQWGEDISLSDIESSLNAHSPKWIWTVHCETSTGYLYDLEGIVSLSKEYSTELCVDACSSLGVVPVDFEDVYFATSVSGKGIGSYPGLGIVFHRDEVSSHPSIPRYLDLGMYSEKGSIPFTHSSNLTGALREALRNLNMFENSQLSDTVKKTLREWNIRMVGDESYSPGVITIEIPPGLSSRVIGDECKKRGILLSYESDYLLKRNWVQVALMGYQREEEVMKAMTVLKGVLTPIQEIRYV